MPFDLKYFNQGVFSKNVFERITYPINLQKTLQVISQNFKSHKFRQTSIYIFFSKIFVGKKGFLDSITKQVFKFSNQKL